MPQRDAFLTNNLLANGPEPPPPVRLPAAEVDVVSPHSGVLSFDCWSSEHFELVELYLRAPRASALLDNDGGRLYITAPEEIETPITFPGRVTVPVEIVDDPGPVTI